MQTFMLSDIKSSKEKGNAKELSIVIIPFDPNIPNNTEDYAKKNIWPELRKAKPIDLLFKCEML